MGDVVGPGDWRVIRKRGISSLPDCLHFHCLGLAGTPILLYCPLLIQFMYHPRPFLRRHLPTPDTGDTKMNETLFPAGDALSPVDSDPS